MKKLIMLMLITLVTLTNSNAQHKLSVTFSPIKGLSAPIRGCGYGIVYSANKLLFSAEHSRPILLNEFTNFVKLGSGLTLYQHRDKDHLVNFNALGMWNKSYKGTLVLPNIKEYSLELGFNSRITYKLNCCFYVDIINWDAKFGIGININQ